MSFSHAAWRWQIPTGNGGSPLRKVRYSHDIEEAIEAASAGNRSLLQRLEIAYTPRWTAIKLLENDEIIRESAAEKAARKGRWHPRRCSTR
jgi:Fe2+ transport system protein B